MKQFLDQVDHYIAFTNMFDSIRDVVFLMKKDGSSFRYIYVNQSGIELLNYEHSILGKKIEDVVPKPLADNLIEKYHQAVSTKKQIVFEDTLHTKEGKKTGETSLNPYQSENGQYQYVLAIVRDITDRHHRERMLREAKEQLEFLAFHDPLTGLKNRRAFTEEIEEVIQLNKGKSRMFAVLFMDMDDFKKINDTYGHEFGDGLLKQFAKRLEYNVQETDVLCRIGGDEFLVLLKDAINKEAVIRSADKIYESIQAPYEIKGKKLRITSSFGIALYPEDGASYKALIRHADIALYKAKEERNRYRFYSS